MGSSHAHMGSAHAHMGSSHAHMGSSHAHMGSSMHTWDPAARLRPPRHARPTVQPPARRVQPAPRSYTGSYGIVLASRQPLHQLAARCLHLHGVS